MTTPARIAVDDVAGRARIRDLSASRYLRPRLLGGADHSRVALVAARASLLAGDHLELEVEVGRGARLELVEPSGTVVYNARGGAASWTARIHVAEGGSLVWPAAPFVVSEGASVRRHTGITMAAGAVVLLRETLVLGRSGEPGGRLRSTLRADLDHHPLQVEDLDLDDAGLRSSPAVLGDHRVIGTVTLLGDRPDELVHPHETLLAGPGAMRRELSTQAHLEESELAPTWTRWRDHVVRAGDAAKGADDPHFAPLV